MATAGSFTKYRSWSTVESEDPNDVGRLYIPENPLPKKVKRTFSTWAFSLVILSLSVMFLVGLLVGYFLKDSQKETCTFGSRRDKIQPHMLHSVHENIMYFISNDNVRKISKELSLIQKAKQTEYVRKELQAYGMDRVEINDYDVVVTYPDPGRSNRLVVLESGTNQVLSNFTLTNATTNRRIEMALEGNVGSTQQGKTHFAEGELVYADYGREIDLIRKNQTTPLKGKILFVKEGHISAQDKVQLALAYGVSGIIIQQSDDSIYYEYAACGDHPRKYSLPVLTVSETVTEQLMIYFLKRKDTGIAVQMTGHFIQTQRMVTNIVACISGDLERDRFVMVGASRSSAIGTSYMLELARSLKDMQKANGWIPRRSIKFYSWDNDGILNLGMKQYTELQNIETESPVVGYIDLDLVKSGTHSHWLQVAGNVMYEQVVKNIVKEIPDPHNANIVLEDTWDGRVHAVRTDTELQLLAVPVLHAVVAQTENLTEKSDEIHHHAYSLAVARVASLVTLRLLDEELLPFSIRNYTTEVYNNILQIIQFVKENFSGMPLIVQLDRLLARAEELRSAGQTFTDYIPQLLKSDDTLAVRRINDAMMRLGRVLSMSNINRSQISSVPISINDGLQNALSNMLSLATVTNDYSESDCYIRKLQQTLLEAMSCLHNI